MVYIMSDIHGYYGRYSKMLELIQFSDEDEIYILGDVIDRGTQGIKILKDIMKRKNVHMLMGNHEHMMMSYFDKIPYYYQPFCKDKMLSLWFGNGGEDTFNHFNAEDENVQNDIMNFIRNLPYEFNIIVNGQAIRLVHGYPAEEELKDNDERYKDLLIWERPIKGIDLEIPENKIVFIGHTPIIYYNKKAPIQKYEVCKNVFDIDGCLASKTFVGRKLICVRLDDMKEFYV